MVRTPTLTRASEGSSPDLLRTIVAATQRAVEVRTQRRPLGALEELARGSSPRGEAFRAALSSRTRLNVIAECKWRSPARGVLCQDYDPRSLARAYASAGAAAVSVLTEPTFFDGSLDHLRSVRSAVELPLLCKDFIASEYQLLEARASGADAVLLIVAALEGRALQQLMSTASALDLATLVEVHDADELAEAVDAGATVIGVNSRNLRTLEVDRDVSDALIARIPSGVVSVAESGLQRVGDLIQLREAGYDAFLIGESLITSSDPGATLRALLAEASTGTGRGESGR